MCALIILAALTIFSLFSKLEIAFTKKNWTNCNVLQMKIWDVLKGSKAAKDRVNDVSVGNSVLGTKDDKDDDMSSTSDDKEENLYLNHNINVAASNVYVPW